MPTPAGWSNHQGGAVRVVHEQAGTLPQHAPSRLPHVTGTGGARALMVTVDLACYSSELSGIEVSSSQDVHCEDAHDLVVFCVEEFCARGDQSSIGFRSGRTCLDDRGAQPQFVCRP